MKALGSVAAVAAAILEDADAEVEAIGREAAASIAAMPAVPADGAAPASAAVAAARERARIAVAQEDWEDARAALGSREAWVGRAVEAGRCRLRAPDTVSSRRNRLGALAREAIDRLPAESIEIVAAETDALLLDDGWKRATLTPAEAVRVSIVVGSVDGGLIARTADRRVQFDNSWAARAERFQSTWRAALADLYEHGWPQ
jgi:vacuolar-type H+-ATPase subunit E/Vma4